LGVNEAGVLKADNLATCMCRMSRNPGSLNLLQPSWPARSIQGLPLW